jgi:hypothetical protein
MIFDRMAEGRDLADILTDPDMPPKRTVYDWMDIYPEFRTHIARGREALAEHDIHRARKIADECTKETADVVRVQLSHLHWRIPKVGQRTYGDRTTNETTVTLKQPPLDLSALPYEQRQALKAILVNQMKTIEHKPNLEDAD